MWEETSGGRTRGSVMAVFALVIWLAISGFLITAGIQAWVNQHWSTATGTVLSCQPVYTYSPRVGGNIPVRTAENCQVRWPAGGAPQQGTVSLAPTARVGDQVALFVHGDSVETRSGQGLGYLFGVLGIAMVLVPLAMLGWAVLTHRQATAPRRAGARTSAPEPPLRPPATGAGHDGHRAIEGS